MAVNSITLDDVLELSCDQEIQLFRDRLETLRTGPGTCMANSVARVPDYRGADRPTSADVHRLVWQTWNVVCELINHGRLFSEFSGPAPDAELEYRNGLCHIALIALRKLEYLAGGSDRFLECEPAAIQAQNTMVKACLRLSQHIDPGAVISTVEVTAGNPGDRTVVSYETGGGYDGYLIQTVHDPVNGCVQTIFGNDGRPVEDGQS